MEFPEAAGDALVTAWAARLRDILSRLDWPDVTIATRLWPGGATLAFAAPPDVLYAATEVNEWAWDVATGDSTESLDEAARRLAAVLEAERRPRLMALVVEAERRGFPCLVDDDALSLGLGAGSRTWPVTELPDPSEVPWDALHEIPVVLVTGSNGKTTTTRMVAAMARAAGHVTGWSTTDGIWVDGQEVEPGDWAGPGGARRVLRDRRVGFAVLETARGGMLRRGLPVDRATAAVVTNVAEDHFGEYGVHDLRDLAAAKLVVGRAMARGGTLVLNADDPMLASARPPAGAVVAWSTTRSASAVAPRGALVSVESGVLTVHGSAGQVLELPLTDAPATHGGRLAHNVANLVAAAAVARAAGLPPAAIAQGARSFSGGATDNPGRANHFALGGGVNVIVDFAHNPEGVAALSGVTALFPGAPITILLGQAGDRSDQAMADLARAAWSLGPARIVLKEMADYRRGREPGEVTAVLRRALKALGCPPDRMQDAPDELAAVQLALQGARPGDLLLLLAHAEPAKVLDLARRLEEAGWAPGHPVPAGA